MKSPQIQPRSAWNASPPKQGRMSNMGVPKRITVHRSDMKEHEQGDPAKWVKSIQEFHQSAKPKGKGWLDVGYHYLISLDGSIWGGRGILWQGAHAANGEINENEHNIGICLLGFEGQTKAQQNALEALILWLRSQWGDLAIWKHSELIDTDCPGKVVGPWVDALREKLSKEFAHA